MRSRVLVVLAAVGCGDPTPPPAPDAAPPPTALPALLSETGLYADLPGRVLAPGVVQFAPQYTLWSDAAVKTRWILLPDGAQIDSSSFEHWTFPVGTRWFKEFAKEGKRLETRVVWRVADTGNREKDTLLGSYLWNEDETEATLALAGADNVRGTQHDVPSAATCWKCHVGEPGRALGYTALQLGDVSALPLSAPPPAGTTYAAPTAALGYLHANCGHCHNENGSAWVSSQMVLQLSPSERDVVTTRVYQTTVNAPLQQWITHGFSSRIVPGDPDNSAVWYRMTQRAPNMQMPPIATELVDPDGVTSVRAWIQSL